ncbi:MAG: Hint domain-containing protein, partial [Pseudomonadota bacterium]
DTLDLSALGSGVTVTYDGDERGTFTDGTDTGTFFGIERVILTEQDDDFDAGATTSGITVDGLGGNDDLVGGSGADLLYGGTGSDSVDAGASADTLYGGTGNDSLVGSAGDDEIYGGADQDTVLGGDDDDTIFGGDDNDSLVGNAGDDQIYGGAGDDYLSSGNDNFGDPGSGDGGADLGTLYGGSGDDSLVGSAAADTIYGGDHDDTIRGRAGADTIYGGEGNDSIEGSNDGAQIYGGAGNDTLTGLSFADTLDGGAGNDTLTGGEDDDVFVVSGGDDTITDFDSDDDDLDGSTNDQLDTSGLSDVGNALTNQDGTVTANEVIVTGGGGSPQVLTFPSGESVQVPDGTVNTTTSGTQFQSLVAMGVPPCFAPGTLILTERGEVPVEHLRLGDMVLTADRGPQPLRWIGKRTVVFGPENARGDKDKPVEIKAGALGHGRDGPLPRRTLVVSPLHRMVLAGSDIAATFDEPEVLALAKALTGHPHIRHMKGKAQIDYFSLLFERHEIIFAEGVATESFRPGHVAMQGFKPHVREQIYQIYPLLRDDPVEGLGPPARQIIGRQDTEDFVRDYRLSSIGMSASQMPTELENVLFVSTTRSAKNQPILRC